MEPEIPISRVFELIEKNRSDSPQWLGRSDQEYIVSFSLKLKKDNKIVYLYNFSTYISYFCYAGDYPGVSTSKTTFVVWLAPEEIISEKVDLIENKFQNSTDVAHQSFFTKIEENGKQYYMACKIFYEKTDYIVFPSIFKKFRISTLKERYSTLLEYLGNLGIDECLG